MKTSQRFLLLTLCLLLIIPLGLPHSSTAATIKSPAQEFELTPQLMPELAAKVTVMEDTLGTPHIFAKKTNDVYFMQGFLHARDRFFQMDVTRRTVEGTLAEILGPGTNNSNISSDVQLRAFNFRDAVNKALPLLRPETRQIIKSYTQGVNAYLKDNPLPPEYQALKITQKRMWADTDTLLVAKGLALNLSFDSSDAGNTITLQAYQAAGKAQGFDGSALFFQDLFRIAPFEPTFALPDATGQPPANRVSTAAQKLQNTQQHQWAEYVNQNIKPETLEMAQDYINKISKIPFLSNGALDRDPDKGSNWFIIAGKNTESGAPLVNNDPHLSLTTPPIWYQIQLNVSKKNKTLLNVTGVSLAGVPGVVLGHNDDIAWAATTTTFDVTDFYQEQIDAQFGSISTIYQGQKETVVFRDETFRVNQITDGKTDNLAVVPSSDSVPARFPAVPRRNNGPIVSLNLSAKTALSIQFAGSGPTLELETFLDFNRAKTITDFQKALDFFDVGSQNFAVATTKGDIGFFTTGEVPLREDLEAGQVKGAPPFLIRDGSGGNEWLPVKNRQPNQSLNYEILPSSELPQVVNPTNGFVVTANNDSVGTTGSNNVFSKKRATGGIYYLSTGYASGNRAYRLTKDIQDALASGKKINTDMARRFQADVRMRDAEVFMPYILQAFSNAQKPGAAPELAALANDPGVKEAVQRFMKWDFSTPTGLRNGYDSFVPYNQSDPSQTQIDASVSTTIYSLWRSQMIRTVIDANLASRQLTNRTPGNAQSEAALRNLLDNFATNKGMGASGIFFFPTNLTNATPETQRDLVILQSIRSSLTALAGPDFAPAFNSSTNQNDYRWGYLHRIVFANSLGSLAPEFSIPSTTGRLMSPLPGLVGLPRDGGFDVPNASGHPIRASKVNDFMFMSGPSKRTTIVMKPGAIDFVTAVPGGQSSSPTSKFHDNLLEFWLTADVYPVVTTKQQLVEKNAKVLTFVPKKIE